MIYKALILPTSVIKPSNIHSKLMLQMQLFCYPFNCRVMEDKASTFEDIVDAYLAYLQVSITMILLLSS